MAEQQRFLSCSTCMKMGSNPYVHFGHWMLLISSTFRTYFGVNVKKKLQAFCWYQTCRVDPLYYISKTSGFGYVSQRRAIPRATSKHVQWRKDVTSWRNRATYRTAAVLRRCVKANKPSSRHLTLASHMAHILERWSPRLKWGCQLWTPLEKLWLDGIIPGLAHISFRASSYHR